MYLLDVIPKKTFSYADVMSAFSISEYRDVATVLSEWEEAGLIRPMKSRGKTSFAPYIFQYYHKVSQKEDYSEEKEQIQRLHPTMIPQLLSHPELYRMYREQADALSEFLIRRDSGDEEACERMSVKERSFQIWGDEKAFEKGSAGKLCHQLHISHEALNAYRTHEMFFVEEFDTHGEQGCALILENKDPWYTLTRLFRLIGCSKLAGTAIRYLIYGEGKKAAQKSEFEEDTMTGCIARLAFEPSVVYYAGDIDRAGFEILQSCQKNNPKLDIQPMTVLYQAMAEEHMRLGRDANTSPDKRGIDYDLEVLSIFDGAAREHVKSILENEQMIPQEVLNAHSYKRLMGVYNG